MTRAKEWAWQQKLGVVLLATSAGTLVFWFVEYATLTAHVVAHVKVSGPEGESLNLVLLEAEPIVHVPIFYAPVHYVQFGTSKSRLHGCAWGYHPGPILISEDRTQIIVTRRYKGSTSGGILINTENGKITQTSRGYAEEQTGGWEHHHWFK
jgi:hypothetical protein